MKCNNSIELSNVREQGLRCHMKSKKHLKSMEPINVFLQPCRQPVITTTTKQSTAELSVRTPLVYQKKMNIGSEFIICCKKESRTYLDI